MTGPSSTTGGRRLRKTFLAAVAALLATVTVTFVLTTSGGTHVEIKFGTKLQPAGQTAYTKAAQNATADGHTQLGSAGLEAPETPAGEALPVERAAALLKANEAAAIAQTNGPAHPVTLATPEPIDGTNWLRINYSSRNGVRPALFVVHDTESPNVPGRQDVLAIHAWFSNPAAKASSHYTTDAEGNTIRLVPEELKAWTQAYFNGWSVSDELIGYASQKTWPEKQLRAAAQIAAASTARWGIPVQRGAVRGCTIIRAGILEHNDLGACGGGHHDAGPAFPIDRFIALVKQYRAGGYHRVKKPPAAPSRPACSVANVQRVLNRGGATLAVDGALGPRSRGALVRFQRHHHLPTTGRLTPATCKALALRG